MIHNEAVLDAVVAALDRALDTRVLLHQERAHRRLTVPEYLEGLRAIREVERVLDPLRGLSYSRAYELAVNERATSEDEAVALLARVSDPAGAEEPGSHRSEMRPSAA